MITLLAIWGWLLVGAAVGRIVFVRTLGDEPRRGEAERKDDRGRTYIVADAWTRPFRRAFWSGLACFAAWPVALPLALMLAHTGAEKLRAKRDRLSAEVARLEADR